MYVGIDVGGANTKYATVDGQWESFYLPLWRSPDVVGVLERVRGIVGDVPCGVVMTGELADCFSSRSEGVMGIARMCAEVFEHVYFFSQNARFCSLDEVMAEPLSFAAANWMASASLVAQSHPDCVFVDVGSTTTDLVPIVHGEVRAPHTDLERLRTGRLVYTGMVRTSVCSLVQKVVLDGRSTPLAREVFATTGDVHTLLGWDAGEWDTADGRGTSKQECMQRLARCVCADAQELGEDAIMDMARQIKDAQLAELTHALSGILDQHPLEEVVAAGIGEPLIAEASRMLGVECSLCSHEYGEVSAVLPSYAVSVLLERWL
ncbi:MAG: hydantoinase/oxoprolinase family protein [Methermicoccaceae archaeon]